jgi:uncharacterized protein (UPF0332 family)
MTDRTTLTEYRLLEAEETLEDAEKMLATSIRPRSVINRAYYAMFYGVLALFNRFETPHRTSKHSTIIGIFNKEFVRTGKMEMRYSRMLYTLFDARHIGDYMDFAELSEDDAVNAVNQARDFICAIKQLIGPE